MSQDDPEITSETIGLVVKMSKLDPSREDLRWPDEEMTHIRIIGCPDMRQCEIKAQFGVLLFRERDKPDSHFVTVDLEQIMRRLWVSIIKANDGLSQKDAFKGGLRTLPGFEYLKVSEETLPK